MRIDRFVSRLSTIDAAKALLGWELTHESPKGTASGVIVETEAYITDDPASHAYKGQTQRNAAMFGKPGTAYIYRIYGIHFCINLVTTPGEAILIRALEPTQGVDLMRQRRGMASEYQLCNGPAKLCQALGITLDLNGHNLNEPPLYLQQKQSIEHNDIHTTTRIGLTKAADAPYRFYLQNNLYISRK